MIYDQIIIYDRSENRELLLFDAGIPSFQFPFSLLGCAPVKSHSAAWVHTVLERSGPVISQLPYLRPKFTVRVLYVPLYTPCGSAPPLLSLTRIASILALVKLTSSLNYANKAVVICICTAWWHEALGVGAAQKKRRNLWRGGARWWVGGRGDHGWNPFVWQGRLIKALPHAKVVVYTGREAYMQQQKHISEGSDGVR